MNNVYPLSPPHDCAEDGHSWVRIGEGEYPAYFYRCRFCGLETEMRLEEQSTEYMIEDAKRFRYLVELCRVDHGSRLVDIATVMLFSGNGDLFRRLVDEERGL